VWVFRFGIWECGFRIEQELQKLSVTGLSIVDFRFGIWECGFRVAGYGIESIVLVVVLVLVIEKAEYACKI